MEASKITMPIFPNLVRRDKGVVSNLFVNIFGISDDALWQDHGHA